MKILIYVEGGNVQMIAASEPVDIVIVDRDDQDAGDNPVKLIEPHEIKAPGTFYELFPFTDNSDVEIWDELKRIKF
jgi:hypothetical protein